MKKLLVILMVVAMASFLFVGCVPTTPAAEEAAEEEEVAVAKTDTPFITAIGGVSLYSTSTQYTNDPTVEGVGVAGALIKVYINDVQTGVGSSGAGGAILAISPVLAELTEGVNVLYITATQPGLAESDPSTKYTFTYDETKPTVASAIGDSSASTVTVTFSEDVDMNLSSTATTFASSALNPDNWYLSVVTLTTDLIADDSTTYTFSKVSDKVVRINCDTNIPALGITYLIGCNNVEDLAENAITTMSYVTAVAIQ